MAVSKYSEALLHVYPSYDKDRHDRHTPIGRWWGSDAVAGDGSGQPMLLCIRLSNAIGVLGADLFFDVQFCWFFFDVSLAGAGNVEMDFISSEATHGTAFWYHRLHCSGLFYTFPTTSTFFNPPVFPMKLACSRGSYLSGVLLTCQHNAVGQGLAMYTGGYLYDLSDKFLKGNP